MAKTQSRQQGSGPRNKQPPGSRNKQRPGARSRSSGGSPFLRIGGVILGLAFVGFIGFFGFIKSDNGSDLGPAPSVVLSNFDGEVVQLTDFRGQGLVVNYWASFCFACLAEMPGFETVYQKRKGEVAILGINLDRDVAMALAVKEYTGITYPVAHDPQASSYVAFGAFTMPTTVFISPEGRILELYSGELAASQLDARIEKYFSS